MVDIFAVASKKVAALPPALRDDIGFELLERVAAWNELRKKIAEGLADIAAGRVVKAPTVAQVMKEVKRRHAQKKDT